MKRVTTGASSISAPITKKPTPKPELTPEELERRVEEKLAERLAAAKAAAPKPEPKPEPVAVPAGPTLAEIEEQMRKAEADYREALVALEERNKNVLSQLMEARRQAEARQAREQESRLDAGAAATLKLVRAERKANVAGAEAKSLEEQKLAAFDRRVAPALAQLKEAKAELVAFEKSYSEEIAAWTSIHRDEWARGLPGEGMHGVNAHGLLVRLEQTLDTLSGAMSSARYGIQDMERQLASARQQALRVNFVENILRSQDTKNDPEAAPFNANMAQLLGNAFAGGDVATVCGMVSSLPGLRRTVLGLIAAIGELRAKWANRPDVKPLQYANRETRERVLDEMAARERAESGERPTRYDQPGWASLRQ